jgi:methylglyoxal synthase
MRVRQAIKGAFMRIAIVAHDDKKDEAVRWVLANRAALADHELFATGTTGGHVVDATGLEVTRMLSGPHGGDQQIGALIAEDRIDALIFFIDSLSPHPHDVDVKALIRIATLKNIPLALNAVTADAVLAVMGRPTKTCDT